MKKIIKKISPRWALGLYHKTLAVAAKIYYGNPSNKLIVIGVTGTNGKSSTVEFIAKILEEAGHKVGYTSTVAFKVADKEWLNDKKMTMLGRFALQGLLKKMIGAGCHYAIIETSSEGVKQNRHWGINYDVVVFTNLTPEHIESHGSFENYQKAKEKLFAKLSQEKSKVINGKKVNKVIVANGDDGHAVDFLKYNADEKIEYGINLDEKNIKAVNINFHAGGLSFAVGGLDFNLKLYGRFNIYNCLAAISVAKSQGISLDICKSALEKLSGVPGRMEFINAGQNFKVLVDYAPEPESLKQCYQTIKDHNIISENGKVIHVLGSCGGGRDISRRPILGEMAAQNADYVIVTNEDPYDDNPQKIIDDVAEGALKNGKSLDQNLFKIIDRKEAIKKAFALAGPGDLVLLTGKGSEQAICVADGKKIPWDERVVARELLEV